MLQADENSFPTPNRNSQQDEAETEDRQQKLKSTRHDEPTTTATVNGDGKDDSEEAEEETIVASHLLVELTSLDELSFPTTSSARIKYTCLTASPHFLAVGSTSGTVYLFSRYAAKYRQSNTSIPVQIITSSFKDGACILMSFSHDDAWLAVGTSNGNVNILSLQSLAQGAAPVVSVSSVLHVGATITAFVWHAQQPNLYIGDSGGKISYCKLANRNVFRSPTGLLHEFDSSIVQLEVGHNQMLVSTSARSYLLPLNDGKPKPIGSKPRTGELGACFYRDADEKEDTLGTRCFVSRPNGRLWEVDAAGEVYSTHQFSKLVGLPLFAPVTYRHTWRARLSSSQTGETAPITVNFARLHQMQLADEHLLVTVCGQRLYFLQPHQARVLLVSDLNTDVLQYSICGSDVFVLLAEDGSLRKYTLFSASKCVDKLIWRRCWPQAAHVIAMLAPTINNRISWKLEDLRLLLRQLQSADERVSVVVVERVKDALRQAERQHRLDSLRAQATRQQQQQAHHRLPGGVHKVVTIMENSGYDDDFTFTAPHQLQGSRRRCLSTPTLNANDQSDDESGASEAPPHVASPRRRPAESPCSSPSKSQSKSSGSLSAVNGLLSDSLRTLLMAASQSREQSMPQFLNESSATGQSKATIDESLNSLILQRHYASGRPGGPQANSRRLMVPVVRAPDLNEVPAANEQSTNEVSVQRKVKKGNKRQNSFQSGQPRSPLAGRKELQPQQQQQQPPPSDRQPHINAAVSNGNIDLKAILFPRSTSTHQNNNNSLAAMEINNSNGDRTAEQQAKLSPSKSFKVFKSTRSPKQKRRQRSLSPAVVAAPAAPERDSPQLRATHCAKCGLSKSWLRALQLSQILERVPVSEHDYTNGGLPCTAEDWQKVLVARVAPSIQQQPPSLCADCNGRFDRMLQQTPVMQHQQQQHGKHKLTDDAELCARMHRVLAGCVKSKPVDGGTNAQQDDAAAAYTNPVYDSPADSAENSPTKVPVESGARVPLAAVVQCMCATIGLQQVLDIFSQQPQLLSAAEQDALWPVLANAAVWRCALPRKVVECVLADVNEPQQQQEEQPTALDTDNGKSAALTPTLTVDVSKPCPCCTLPLHTRVSESQSGLALYPCAHAYHAVCVRNMKHLPRNACYACRAAQQPLA